MTDRPDNPMSNISMIDLAERTAEIVTAYVGNNAVPADDVARLIETVHGSLLRTTQSKVVPEAEPLNPAVPIKRSVQEDRVICLEDGKAFKSLKRHLSTHHAMTPDEYREKWGLPANYPMVAPGYAAERSALARKIGLGRKAGTEPAAETAEPDTEAQAKPEPKAASKRAAKPATKTAKVEADTPEAASPKTAAKPKRAPNKRAASKPRTTKAKPEAAKTNADTATD